MRDVYLYFPFCNTHFMIEKQSKTYCQRAFVPYERTVHTHTL